MVSVQMVLYSRDISVGLVSLIVRLTESKCYLFVSSMLTCAWAEWCQLHLVKMPSEVKTSTIFPLQVPGSLLSHRSPSEINNATELTLLRINSYLKSSGVLTWQGYSNSSTCHHLSMVPGTRRKEGCMCYIFWLLESIWFCPSQTITRHNWA